MRWTSKVVCVRAALAGAIGLLSSVAAADVSYHVTDLGVLIGGDNARPGAIDAAGHTAIASQLGGSFRALIYPGYTTVPGLGTLGGPDAMARGVNVNSNTAKLQAVGLSTTNGGDTHAFVWTLDGTDGVAGNLQMRDLGTAGFASEAAAINAHGFVAGFRNNGTNDKAFVYNYATGTFNELPALANRPNSYAFAINDSGTGNSGHVAGMAYNSTFSTYSAFFYNGSTIQSIGNLGGGTASALGINAGDIVVGYSSDIDGYDHAFKWDGSSMIDLTTLGGHYSYAFGINSSNTIVGGSFTDASDSTYHAFVTSGPALLDLNNYLDSSGAGWTLGEARSINDSGVIVGSGTYAGDGLTHAFMLTPTPEPSSGLLLGIGLLTSGVLGRRRG